MVFTIYQVYVHHNVIVGIQLISLSNTFKIIWVMPSVEIMDL